MLCLPLHPYWCEVLYVYIVQCVHEFGGGVSFMYIAYIEVKEKQYNIFRHAEHSEWRRRMG